MNVTVPCVILCSNNLVIARRNQTIHSVLSKKTPQLLEYSSRQIKLEKKRGTEKRELDLSQYRTQNPQRNHIIRFGKRRARKGNRFLQELRRI